MSVELAGAAAPGLGAVDVSEFEAQLGPDEPIPCAFPTAEMLRTRGVPVRVEEFEKSFEDAK